MSLNVKAENQHGEPPNVLMKDLPERESSRMKRRLRNMCLRWRTAVRTVPFYGLMIGCGILAQTGETVSADETDARSDFEIGKTLVVLPASASTKPIADTPASKIAILDKEIQAGLRERKLSQNLLQFQNYTGYQLNLSTGTRRVNEVTGNCRLDWYDHLMRNPLTTPAESEAFTRRLFESIQNDHRGLERTLAIARSKMDVPLKTEASVRFGESTNDPLTFVSDVLERVQRSHTQSLAPLTPAELSQLQRELYPILVSQNDVGYTLANRGRGRRICDMLEKIDRGSLHDAAETMAPLADRNFLSQLKRLPEDSPIRVAGVSGSVVKKIDTAAGTIIVGGRGSNTYDLDAMSDVNVVIDLGGNDVYREGTVSLDRPVLITIDLAGNDTYTGTKPGIQGSAILGVAMLVDLEGNDTYQAKDMAQASCLGGVGMLVDHGGHDRYTGFRRVQGQAFAGIGLLLDRDGNDQYRGAMWTQGMGCPLGFGMLVDLDGKDHYYTGGYFICSYADDEDNPTPGYEGWGQGVGAGLRSVASGGIGVMLDGDGDDIYEFDYLSHGGGYWLGLGFARDFGGNDQRVGATVKSFSGGRRGEPLFQRFGMGFGCHYAAGFCFDDEGNDTYNGTIMGLGHAWDASIGLLSDFSGNDQYSSKGKTTQGNGSQAGLGILFDYDGDDRYRNYSQGYASSSISYHEMPHCGGNFSFLVDHGGTDGYGSRVRNNTISRRGSTGGFLIDRYSPEIKPTPKKTSQSTQRRRTATNQTQQRTYSRRKR